MKHPIKDIENLATTGFVSMKYPPQLRAAVEKAVASWQEFCALPTEVKRGLPYSNNADGVGYELKDGVGNKADHKENFDVTTGSKRWLTENAGKVKNAVALCFIEDASALVALTKPLIVEFARQAEEAFALPDFTKEVEQGEDAYFIRFIHYFGDRTVGEEIASAHADQSGFTPHLYESAAGLQCLTREKQWIDMPVSADETVIIPSMQMQLRSSGQLKATCHRVVATAQTAKEGRYSAVCFVQLKKTPKYDKERCGRLQEKAPGFNYEMPKEDFEGLFRR
ncbi:MAG: 2OG-Fe(II) oxygenase family protein [Patescibacteria group bacterium]